MSARAWVSWGVSVIGNTGARFVFHASLVGWGDEWGWGCGVSFKIHYKGSVDWCLEERGSVGAEGSEPLSSWSPEGWSWSETSALPPLPPRSFLALSW